MICLGDFGGKNKGGVIDLLADNTAAAATAAPLKAEKYIDVIQI